MALTPEDRLEATIPALMEQARVPGLSIALVRGGTTCWSRAFGHKDVGTMEAVGIDTVFQAASLSKPVFAYAVLQLAERGVIDLDTPLTTYLPDPYVPDDPLLDRITARRVLSHTTGWPNWRPANRPLKQDRVPGEGFGYSGEGYLYLQRVVEQVTGQPFDGYMRQALLEPLGMTRSSYRWAAPDDPAVAVAHDRDGAVRARYAEVPPEAASSLHTTAEDFARFLEAILLPGDEPWRLSPSGVARMLRPHVQLTHAVAWGLGWGLQVTRDGRAFWHWGDNPGYKSVTLTSLDARQGVVVLMNGDNGSTLWEPIVRLALGGDYPAFAWLASFYGVPTLVAAGEGQGNG